MSQHIKTLLNVPFLLITWRINKSRLSHRPQPTHLYFICKFFCVTKGFTEWIQIESYYTRWPLQRGNYSFNMVLILTECLVYHKGLFTHNITVTVSVKVTTKDQHWYPVKYRSLYFSFIFFTLKKIATQIQKSQMKTFQSNANCTYPTCSTSSWAIFSSISMFSNALHNGSYESEKVTHISRDENAFGHHFCHVDILVEK